MTGSDDRHAAEVAENGRERVRRHLVERLRAAGLKPERGRTQAQLDEVFRHLVDHFAYMTADNLDTLAELVMGHAGGASRDQAPSELAMRKLGEALQAKPFEESRIVTSWLASVEGPKARAGGWLTELYRWLRRHHRPPTPYDVQGLRAEAEANARMRSIIEERLSRGAVQPSDAQWFEAYLRDEAEALRLVAGGDAARAARDGGGAA